MNNINEIRRVFTLLAWMGYTNIENRFNYDLMLFTGPGSEMTNYLLQVDHLDALVEETLQ